MKKTILIFLAIIILGGVGYFVYKAPIEVALNDIKSQKSIADPKNAVYIIEGEKITLVNGVAETDAISGSASKNLTEYFGNEVMEDFNGDGTEDIAFLLTQDGGGTGVFYYVTTLLGSQDSYTGTNAIFLGDRIAPQATEFKNGEIIVNYADRKIDEPMATTPSVGVSKYFKVSGGGLVEVEKNIQTNTQTNTQTKTQTSTQVVKPSGCPIDISVSGGLFAPETCQFDIIGSGELCEQNKVCSPGYALNMKDVKTSHIGEMTLAFNNNFSKTAYRFDLATGAKDFIGQVVDEKSIARNLIKGEVYLGSLVGGKITFSLDLLFANNISIKASGTLPVVRSFAP